MLLREHRERWLANTIRGFTLNGRVLDVGAKEARHKALFPISCSYEALDASPKSPEVRKGDAHHLSYKDGTFDCVLLMEVLEHVADPQRVLSECSRVLKPGGRLLFSTPYLAMPAHGDYWRFSIEGLRLLFEKAGLSIVREEKYGGILAIHATWIETLATARKWGAFFIPLAAVARLVSRAERAGMSYCESFYVLEKRK